jgi:hypothetical protein
VEAEPAGARLPRRPGGVLAQPGQFVPALAAVGGLEQRGVLDPRIDGVGLGQRRGEVPDPGELPRVGRAVVPLVGAGHAVVGELVADRLPGLPAVVGALDQLPEPRRRLGRVDPVGVNRRSGEVVDLPAAEVGPVDVPVLSPVVGRQDESAAPLLWCRSRPSPCPDQHTRSAHRPLLSGMHGEDPVPLGMCQHERSRFAGIAPCCRDGGSSRSPPTCRSAAASDSPCPLADRPPPGRSPKSPGARRRSRRRPRR